LNAHDWLAVTERTITIMLLMNNDRNQEHYAVRALLAVKVSAHNGRHYRHRDQQRRNRYHNQE